MATISHRVSNGISFKQAEPFKKYVTEANHNGFLEDRTIQIIDFRVFGGGRNLDVGKGFGNVSSTMAFLFTLFIFFSIIISCTFYNTSENTFTIPPLVLYCFSLLSPGTLPPGTIFPTFLYGSPCLSFLLTPKY